MHIPKQAKKDNTPLPSTGIVVQLGEELRNENIQPRGIIPCVQEGDMIMFSRFAGTDFRVDEEDFRILEENEVMCTLLDVHQVVTPVLEDE